MSEIQTKTFEYRTLFSVWNPNSKNPNGAKSLDFRQKKSVWDLNICVWILDTFNLHTSDNSLPSTYSVRLNVGVSNQNQKACCKPFRSQWYTFEHLDFRHCLKSELAEIRKFCVCPKNPKCLKSKCAEIRTSFCLDFGTVLNLNIQILDIHYINSPFYHQVTDCNLN